MAQMFNRISKTLYQITQELLELFAINIDERNSQESSEVGDIDD